MPELRGRLSANQRLADITWFRVGGPAQVLFSPADEADLAYFLAACAGRPAGDGDRPRLQPARARRRRARRRDPARARLRRREGRAGAPAARRHRGSRRRSWRVRQPMPASPGLAFYRGIPGSIGGALRMNGGAHGRETKDTLIEARAVDRQGKHPRARPRRPGLDLSPLRRAGRLDLHRGRLPGHARRAGRDPAADGGGRAVSRGQPADQGAHGRLDVQEPARQQRLAADRRCGLPRACGSAAPRSRRCTATS